MVDVADGRGRPAEALAHVAGLVCQCAVVIRIEALHEAAGDVVHIERVDPEDLAFAEVLCEGRTARDEGGRPARHGLQSC